MPEPTKPDSFEFEKVSVDDARKVLEDSVKPVVERTRPNVAWEQRRKGSAGAEMLKTATLQWILKLPPRVQPRHLQLRYPRIANRIAAAWGDVAECETYLDSLLEDKRGGRKGFPLQVAQEVAGIRDHYFRLHHKNLTAWDHVETGR